MATQTSTTGSLENASKEMIAQAMHTEEHEAPCLSLVRRFNLLKGHDTLVLPKVGQMTMLDLNEGEENVNEQDIGMSTVSVTANIIGAVVKITDKLLDENSADIWQIVGKQMGDAAARIKDTKILDLFTALNGGTTLGAAGTPFSANFATSCIGVARANKYGSDLWVVHHPNAILRLNRDLSTIGSGQIRPIPEGFSAKRLTKFFDGIVLSGVPFFHDGNISRDSSDDAIGAIADRDALAYLSSVEIRREKKRLPELGDGGWALYVTARFGVVERDDDRGAPLTFDAVDPATS